MNLNGAKIYIKHPRKEYRPVRHISMKAFSVLVFCLSVSAVLVFDFPRALAYPLDGLVAYYPFTGNAQDQSGGSNDGILHNVIPASDRFGNMDSAYRFDANSYIEIPYNQSFDFGTGDFTLSAWIKTSGDGWIITRGYEDKDGERGYLLNIIGGSLGFYNLSIGGPGGIGVSIPVLKDNAWHHIAAVRDEYKLKLYFDGELAGSSNYGAYGIDYSSSHPLYIGAIVYYSGDTAASKNTTFDGMIDDVSIYNRALTDAEIEELYSGIMPPSTTAARNDSSGGCFISVLTDVF